MHENIEKIKINFIKIVFVSLNINRDSGSHLARLEVQFDNPDDILILKAPTKYHLKMPSADVVCCTLLLNKG